MRGALARREGPLPRNRPSHKRNTKEIAGRLTFPRLFVSHGRRRRFPHSFPARTKSRRAQVFVEQGIKAFFGGNALVAVIVLALITIFLFREGFGFFGQNLSNLRLYRQAGLEYVDIIRAVSTQHEALSRKLSEIRLSEVRAMEKRQVPLQEINAALAPFDQFATNFSDAAENLHGLVSDLTEQASG